jgi:hypothetical protein
MLEAGADVGAGWLCAHSDRLEGSRKSIPTIA